MSRVLIAVPKVSCRMSFPRSHISFSATNIRQRPIENSSGRLDVGLRGMLNVAYWPRCDPP